MTFTSPDRPPPELSALGLAGDRPLLIVDVDEVLGLFMEGFARYLGGQGLEGRARWLKRHGMDYPLLINSGLKGPVAAALAAQAAGPAVFIDDMIPNLDSVAEHAPAVARFQTVADPRLRSMAPSRPDLHPRIDGWDGLEAAITGVLDAALR